ncbi:MAG: hypothetical protein HOO06_04110 [Bdellovibrionaceae bacterium]|jgi:hypothetical protein|nr:hypothetical protein [Pseudobdellovibrionaceae bacterium]
MIKLFIGFVVSIITSSVFAGTTPKYNCTFVLADPIKNTIVDFDLSIATPVNVVDHKGETWLVRLNQITSEDSTLILRLNTPESLKYNTNPIMSPVASYTSPESKTIGVQSINGATMYRVVCDKVN